MVLLSIIFLVFLMRADWEKIAMEVHLKMKKKSSMTEDLLQDNRIWLYKMREFLKVV